MPLIESFEEFSQRHGDDPIMVAAVGRRIWSNGASCESFAGHHHFHDPPPGDFDRLKLQIARQSELVERAREAFHDYRRDVYAGGWEGAIPRVRELRDSHDAAYRELERLQAALKNTPEEQARLKALAYDRAREQAWIEERGKVQAAVGAITLCTETQGQPLEEEES